MEKSHVSLEQAQCIVCGNVHDTGNILLDTTLRASMDRTTLTHNDICPTCVAQLGEGYFALVEASAPSFGRDKLQPHEANRTGRMAWIKREHFPNLFGQPAPVDKNGAPLPMCFVEPGTVAALEAMMK